MAQEDSILEVQGLNHVVSGNRILDDVGFSVAEGQFVGILGPNGAGKSTLVKHLVGILQLQAGVVRLAGRALPEITARERARLIAYVPQVHDFSSPFTALELVLMGRYPHLSPFTTLQAEDVDLARAALIQVGMEDFARRLLHTLSGGEQQKVFLAAALAQDARIVALDEPTTFLDPKFQVEMYELLRCINATGKTLVMVTHDVNAAATYCDSILGLKDGKVVFRGTPGDVMQAGALREIYDTGFDFVTPPGGTERLCIPRAAGGGR